MGNRANYILKRNESFEIFYTHWRSINIAHDLTIGPKKFTQFVERFDKSNDILDEPWIEGCVLVDFDLKKLTFWESEFLDISSIREEYLNQLAIIWDKWTIHFAENEMYDIEKELNISYTQKQEVDFEIGSLDKITDFNEDDDFFSGVVILIENSHYFVKYVNGGYIQEIALIGERIIEKLRAMKNRELQKESDDELIEPIILDIDHKTLWVNLSMTGLESQLNIIWKDWKVNARNFGYINILQLAGIDVKELKMTNLESKEFVYSEIMNQKDDFNPNKLAQIMKSNIGIEVRFNEHFFQNEKPKMTILKKLKTLLKK